MLEVCQQTTKIRAGKPLVCNISIPRYHFISQPSNKEAGGLGFYIRDDCDLHDRSDLTLSTDDFENLSIEIHRKSQNHIICSAIYRHPNSNFDNFFSILQSSWIKFRMKGNTVF